MRWRKRCRQNWNRLPERARRRRRLRLLRPLICARPPDHCLSVSSDSVGRLLCARQQGGVGVEGRRANCPDDPRIAFGGDACKRRILAINHTDCTHVVAIGGDTGGTSRCTKTPRHAVSRGAKQSGETCPVWRLLRRRRRHPCEDAICRGTRDRRYRKSCRTTVRSSDSSSCLALATRRQPVFSSSPPTSD
jgi:hypothetical protein